FPIMNIALTGKRTQSELYDLATNVVQPKLLSILGVADVQVSGGLTQEVQLKLDYAKLEAYGLTVDQVTNALNRANVSSPAGTLPSGRKDVTIRSYGGFQSIDDINNLAVATTPTGTVYVHDIGTAALGYKTVTRLQRLNGQPALGLIVTKQSDANALQVANDVRAALTGMQRSGQIPPDVQLVITNDTSRFTQAALNSVQNDLVLAILLTAAVLLLFLHTWRNTLIVILAIPTSLVSTFLVMYAMGFNLDTISLMALALMIGILVDDSIVVLENIHRHLHLGEDSVTAALKGRGEIGLAAIAITLTDVVVYVPVAFMQGNLGKLFREYGLTIAAATLFSLFISFTLTPMLASRWLSPKTSEPSTLPGPFGLIARAWERFTVGWENGFDGVRRVYGRVLAWGLDHRPVIIFIGVLALVAAYSFIPTHLLSTEYSPQEDDSQLSVSLDMPPGTTLAQTDAATKQLEAGLKQIPEIKTTFTSVSAGGGGFGGGGSSGDIAVELVDKTQRSRSVFQIINQVR
ncbi:MAG TPA: efflux RND transporter permease subunit, partial [Chloroflexota bacterium]|nr:efflux RND transporter permease subunit [Chloroflexota bacterium]